MNLKPATLMLSLGIFLGMADAEAELVSVKLERQGPVLLSPLKLADATIPGHWFSFDLVVTDLHPVTPASIQRVSLMFDGKVGACQVVDRNGSPAQATVNPGETLVLSSLYCGGLDMGEAYEHLGVLSVEGLIGERPLNEKLSIKTK